MEKFTAYDRRFMRLALELARGIKGTTFPNPAVGAIVVLKNRIIGRGATADGGGGPHAEKRALKDAGERARGATLYVSLEPCCHFGKTPPCTDAVVAAGIKRVVVAVSDPNPLVAGKGIRQLRRRGITVDAGLLRGEAAAVNEDFFWAITRRRAFITLKLALTLDGRIADRTGESRWITGTALRRIVHDLRRTHAAVAVGSGTLAADDPQLTVRFGRKTNPARIVFASSDRILHRSFFHEHACETRSIIVVRQKTERRIVSDPSSGIEFWYTGIGDPCASMAAFTEMAFEQNLTSIFVEGGRKIASVLLEGGLVNRLYLFYGNRIVGRGIEAFAFEHGFPVAN
ncbi:MAG: bifunctional diaminohydroxyphosphoribosylaminopyrimidine deaminase/5-amino-6-(5-phosphoribosylamino)uracil reductase RibD, partial [Chitinispirillaceae bacterium]|nr:bifunctional diaminohydroxyphosphoribosylaminopyrimidine deaminase/5-amino-6-(5-phosphoribosylamino)uracil reductase RibD [Chitinispirillaceae bacterium]